MLEQEPLETIHLYIVREDETQQEQSVVDSTIQESEKINAQPLVATTYPLRLRLVPYLLLTAHLVIILAAVSMQVYTRLTDTATITIIPKSYSQTFQLTLANVASRMFQPITLTQSKTVATTGHGHQNATVATGTITFYNAATFAQTIDAGTLLTGADGVQVVTDQEALLPSAIPPLEGQATVTAHTVIEGAAGNIRAGDITGSCCKLNIFVANSAFSGGQDERRFPIVTPADIHGVVSSLLPAVTHQINRTFQKQVQKGETLTQPLCSETVSPDHQPGAAASQVTVIVRESCLAGAYTRSDLQVKVREAVAQQAIKTVGRAYTLSSYIPLSPVKPSIQQGRLVLSAIYQGILIYQFTTHDLTMLRQQLAGKSRQQAISTLAHLSGAAYVTVQLGKQSVLPTDPTHIHIVFLLVS